MPVNDCLRAFTNTLYLACSKFVCIYLFFYILYKILYAVYHQINWFIYCSLKQFYQLIHTEVLRFTVSTHPYQQWFVRLFHSYQITTVREYCFVFLNDLKKLFLSLSLFFLATPHTHGDLSFPTRGRTPARCSVSVES